MEAKKAILRQQDSLQGKMFHEKFQPCLENCKSSIGERLQFRKIFRYNVAIFHLFHGVFQSAHVLLAVERVGRSRDFKWYPAFAGDFFGKDRESSRRDCRSSSIIDDLYQAYCRQAAGVEVFGKFLGGDEMAMEKEIAKAVWGLIEPKLDKKLAAMEERILSKIQGGQNEQLLTIQEASRRLNVNKATIRALAAAGELVIKSPNGRNKILESSINSYIGRLQEKAG